MLTMILSLALAQLPQSDLPQRVQVDLPGHIDMALVRVDRVARLLEDLPPADPAPPVRVAARLERTSLCSCGSGAACICSAATCGCPNCPTHPSLPPQAPAKALPTPQAAPTNSFSWVAPPAAGGYYAAPRAYYQPAYYQADCQPAAATYGYAYAQPAYSYGSAYGYGYTSGGACANGSCSVSAPRRGGLFGFFRRW